MRHLRLDVVTIFPEYLAPLDLSLIGKARRDGLLTRAVSGSEAGGRAAYVAFWQE